MQSSGGVAGNQIQTASSQRNNPHTPVRPSAHRASPGIRAASSPAAHSLFKFLLSCRRRLLRSLCRAPLLLQGSLSLAESNLRRLPGEASR